MTPYTSPMYAQPQQQQELFIANYSGGTASVTPYEGRGPLSTRLSFNRFKQTEMEEIANRMRFYVGNGKRIAGALIRKKGLHTMTTDARLSALERSQIDTNHEISILTGVIGEQGRDIKRMLAVLEQHTHTLDVHTASLQTIEQALATLITEVRDIKQIVTQNGQE